MTATARLVSSDEQETPGPVAFAHLPMLEGPNELELIDRVIEDCLRAHAMATSDLQEVVAQFRDAFGRHEPSEKLLALARDVHFALVGVNRVEAALHRLRSERSARAVAAEPRSANA